MISYKLTDMTISEYIYKFVISLKLQEWRNSHKSMLEFIQDDSLEDFQEYMKSLYSTDIMID